MKQSLWCLLVCVAAFRCSVALITRVQCSTSDKGTCTEPTCNVVKTSTGVVVANYGCKDLTRPLDKIIVHFKLFRKMRSQYYQVGYFPKFDYCEFITNFDETNVFYFGLKLLKEKVPESVHECPYIDSQLQTHNLTLATDDFRKLPAGKYKVICTFSDDIDYQILKMITHVTI